MCAQQRCTGRPGKTVGSAANRPVGGQAEVDDLLLAVGPQAKGDQHRPPDRAGTGASGEHDTIQHQDTVRLFERPGMEGGDHPIELLGDLADRRRADRPAKDRQQGLADLAGRQPEDKARQDHAVDLLGAPGIGAYHRERREPAGARHQELDVAKLGQQMARVGAVAPVGFVEHRHPVEMLVDRSLHLAAHNAGNRLPTKRPITLAPFQPLRLHALHQLEGPR